MIAEKTRGGNRPSGYAGEAAALSRAAGLTWPDTSPERGPAAADLDPWSPDGGAGSTGKGIGDLPGSLKGPLA